MMKVHLLWIYTTSRNIWPRSFFLFLILKELFLIKQVKHQNGIIYHTKYKSFWASWNKN